MKRVYFEAIPQRDISIESVSISSKANGLAQSGVGDCLKNRLCLLEYLNLEPINIPA